ncbi:hypothetical protein NQZ68_004434 [Dissostichus eleginoides]|nr:hypothetical protein NQZ68_004434 [Dissostichus eleginoides]
MGRRKGEEEEEEGGGVCPGSLPSVDIPASLSDDLMRGGGARRPVAYLGGSKRAMLSSNDESSNCWQHD